MLHSELLHGNRCLELFNRNLLLLKSYDPRVNRCQESRYSIENGCQELFVAYIHVAPVCSIQSLLGLSRIPSTLYVSESVFFPSRLTTQISLALSPWKSTWILSTIGSRQLRWLPRGPAKCSANFESQLTTAIRPSGSKRERVAPRT